MDGVNEFDACRGCHQILALATDVVALEEGLDDAGTGGWSADSVLLQCCTKFFVFYEFTGCLHRTQQGCLGIILRWRGPFLRQGRLMFSRFAFCEGWEGSFFYHFLLGAVSRVCVSVGVICIVVIGILRILGIDYSPARFENLLTAYLELYLLRFGSVFVDDFAQYGGGREFTVRIEHADESLGDEIIDIRLHIGESGWRNSGWDDGVVIGYLAVIEYLLALRQLLAGGCELLDEWEVFLLTGYLCLAHTVQNLRTFRIDIVGQELGIYTRISGVLLLVETLDELQRNIGRVGKLLVAIHLQ